MTAGKGHGIILVNFASLRDYLANLEEAAV